MGNPLRRDSTSVLLGRFFSGPSNPCPLLSAPRDAEDSPRAERLLGTLSRHRCSSEAAGGPPTDSKPSPTPKPRENTLPDQTRAGGAGASSSGPGDAPKAPRISEILRRSSSDPGQAASCSSVSGAAGASRSCTPSLGGATS